MQNKLIIKEDSIISTNDFELNIARDNKLTYKYSYPENTKLKGFVFIIPGFGADSDNEYGDNLRNYIAKTFGVVAVNVFYHCFYSRPNNGATIIADETDQEALINEIKKHDIDFSDKDQIEEILEKLNTKLVGNDSKVYLPMTIMPKNNEYQNFGILQALDHLNVLCSLEKKGFDFESNYSTTLLGSSHGAYIAYLCAKLSPNKIDTVIDNSAYVKPNFKYITGKEISHLKPECRMPYSDNIIFNCFVKTNWTLNKSLNNYFCDDRYMIRDITNDKHLTIMNKYANNKTKYISYHSASDKIAPIEDKKIFFESLNNLGFDTTLHIIDDTKVDGKFIKNLKHGMDMSLKVLANRELPLAIEVRNKKTPQETITYDCDSLRYKFDFSQDVISGSTIDISDQEESLVEIKDPNEFIQTNLNDNISYLQEHQPELFSKISAIESAIEQGHYQEKYELVYEDNGFDVLEKSTNTYLYDKNIAKHTSLAQKSIDYKLEDNLFESFHKQDILDEDLQKFTQAQKFKESMSGFAPVIKYTLDNTSNKNIIRTIKKFIFFGVGLGFHIDSIHKKISSKVYLIVEDDLELFRLSLFTTNYKNLAKDARLIFSVFEDNDEFLKTAEIFLKHEYYYNHYLKYFHMLSHSDDKPKQFHIAISSQAHLLFFYNALLVQYTSPIEYLQDNYNFLNKSLNFSNTEFEDKAFLLLAAGPSLQKNIKWLKQNHKKFIIVAISATLPYLEKEGITPNIITHLDAFENANVHFENIGSLEFIKDSICFFSARTAKSVTSKFSKEKLFFFENGTQYKESSIKPSAPCVGSLTYQLLIILKAQTIYTIGLDLAVDSETGKTHSGLHEYAKTLSTQENAFDDSQMKYKESLFSIEGNFSKTVLTTPHFKTSIDTINYFTKMLKQKEQNIYNLSDGAKFLDSTAKKCQDIDINIELKNETQKQLLNICTTNSSAKLTKDEVQNINNKRAHSQKLKDEILKYQNLNSTNELDYINNLINLSSTLANEDEIKNYELSRVFDTYFKYIFSFIFNFFNSQEYTQEHSKNIDNLLIKHLIEIIDYYYERTRLK